VHNAPAGYWTVATHCHAPSSAISAWRGSFAAGLFDAATETLAEHTPVLFAAYDIAACGPLADFIQATMPFGVALLLNHERGPRTLATLRLRHDPEPVSMPVLPPEMTAFADAAPLALSLPLFVALARAQPASLQLPSGTTTALAIEVRA
jgi:hypothetical protein